MINITWELEEMRELTGRSNTIMHDNDTITIRRRTREEDPDHPPRSSAEFRAAVDRGEVKLGSETVSGTCAEWWTLCKRIEVMQEALIEIAGEVCEYAPDHYAGTRYNTIRRLATNALNKQSKMGGMGGSVKRVKER